MPNRDLDPLLVDRVTRRRITTASVSGQTRSTHVDQEGIRCRVAPKGGRGRRTPGGVIAEAEMVVTFDPDADVRGPGEVVADVLLVTAGAYVGTVLRVEFVRTGVHLPHRAAEAKRLPEVPRSTPAP